MISYDLFILGQTVKWVKLGSEFFKMSKVSRMKTSWALQLLDCFWHHPSAEKNDRSHYNLTVMMFVGFGELAGTCRRTIPRIR